MRSGRGSCAGFTLVELGVALVVFGLLALASVPAMSRYIQDYRLEGTASNLVGDIRLCRHRAIAEANDYIMLLDTDGETYSILDDDNSNGQEDDGENLLGPVDLPGGMDLRNGPWIPFPDDELILHPNGTANSTGILTIVNKAGRQRLLYITAATGNAKKLWEFEAH
jgi:prepilin-type N-terminal cleavage/methylation domain-containing protein